MTISGEMPKWRRYFHRFAGGFMRIVFLGFVLMSAHFIWRAVHDGVNRPPFVFSFLFAAMAIGGFGSTLWFQRRIVCAFSYDTHALHFRTLGSSRIQMRPSRDIVGIRECAGGRERWAMCWPFAAITRCTSSIRCRIRECWPNRLG